MAPRFLTLTDVAETLNVSLAQVKALVRSGELPAIKIGGRGAWRVEASELEAYIARMYTRTRELIGRDRPPSTAQEAPEGGAAPRASRLGPGPQVGG